jgi:hypothetical protein
MSVTSLDMPFIEGGLRTTHYFNGRILSREDLQRDWDAQRAIHERLGMALGEGIVRGFEVAAKVIGGGSVADPVVTVSPGLALNRLGQTVALDRPVDVALKKPTAIQSSGTSLSGSFNDCAPPEETVYVAGSGVYLLAVAPAQVKQGLALVSGLGNGTATCNVKEVVHGVQFRLLEVTGLSAAELNKEAEAHLRNVVAYKFFFAAGIGTGATRDPFGVAPAAPALTDSPLTDCEVPLAVLHWTTTEGLRWVDLWSVRRRVAPRADGLLPGAAGAAVGEAMLMQFSDQVRELWSSGGLSAPASKTFQWLPPAGMVPVSLSEPLPSSGPPAFFGGLMTRGPLFMEGADVPAFLPLATSFPPIAVGDPELVWLYLVRENRQPTPGQAPAQPYLVFAQGRMPCLAFPRFDVSRWDYANFALE